METEYLARGRPGRRVLVTVTVTVLADSTTLSLSESNRQADSVRRVRVESSLPLVSESSGCPAAVPSESGILTHV